STLDPLGHPVTLYRLLNAASEAFSVDDTLNDSDLRSLAMSVFGMPADSMAFLNAPIRGGGMEGQQSVIWLDDTRCAQLWNAVRTDSMSGYVSQHHEDLLSGTPN